jgi:GAF domain-containing protein
MTEHPPDRTPRQRASSEESASSGQVEDVTGALEALGAALDTGTEVKVVLQQVCSHVVAVVPGAEIASVTLVNDSVAETAACTGDLVLHLDAEQYALGRGPCLDAAASGKIVRVAIEQAGRRWPEFAASARKLGVGSYLSAPLVADAEHRGAINLFSTQPHGFRQVDGALLGLYVTAVEMALRAATRYRSAQRLVEQLQEALTSRPIIDQAKGILMAARGLTEEEAFAVLTQQSQHDNVKLRAVATRFVAQVLAGQQR